jgi:NAD(P)-dependent dehydrogenase (short-subunit alcohol dehydrogenase family)
MLLIGKRNDMNLVRLIRIRTRCAQPDPALDAAASPASYVLRIAAATMLLDIARTDWTMATMAIVGAGPGLGLSLARRFGREGLRVGLIARRLAVLEDCVRQLAAEGIDAVAYSADAGDERQLTAALDSVEQRFGGVDVLEFSPMPFTEMPRFTAATTTVDDVMRHVQVQTLGAVVGTRRILPGMLQRRRGSLLFTTGMSAVTPLPLLTPIGIAMSGVRNYARCLHQELGPSGIYACTISIAVQIQRGTAGDPDTIADFYWQLHTKRERGDVQFPDVAAVPP